MTDVPGTPDGSPLATPGGRAPGIPSRGTPGGSTPGGSPLDGGRLDGYGGTAPSVAGLGDHDLRPTPGQQAVVMAALTIGLLMMGLQLWLLTVSLELYLSGEGARGWLLALVSGLIFVGGLWMLRLLDRRPRLGGRRE